MTGKVYGDKPSAASGMRIDVREKIRISRYATCNETC